MPALCARAYTEGVSLEQSPQRSVTSREREHMREIGRWQQQCHDEALRAHLALPPRERLAAAFALMADGPHFQPQFPRDDEGPAAFYERAKKLGLYKG